jgi:hypothetical protein
MICLALNELLPPAEGNVSLRRDSLQVGPRAPQLAGLELPDRLASDARASGETSVREHLEMLRDGLPGTFSLTVRRVIDCAPPR